MYIVSSWGKKRRKKGSKSIPVVHSSSPVHRLLTAHLQQLTSAQKVLISEVILLAKLILVMPATNAISERSFSALRRMKTYLRSTMKQERLNSIMTLHIHKDLTDKLQLDEVANSFVSKSDRRQQVFGKF